MSNLLNLIDLTDRELILIVTGAVGISFIISKEKIFKSLREAISLRSIKIGELMSCPKCLGPWAGLIAFALVKLGLSVILLCFTSYLACYLVYLISSKR